jgi:hypothetical protein
MTNKRYAMNETVICGMIYTGKNCPFERGFRRMGRAVWFLFAASLILYAAGLILLAKLQYDAAFVCLAAFSVLFLSAAAVLIVRLIRRKRNRK